MSFLLVFSFFFSALAGLRAPIRCLAPRTRSSFYSLSYPTQDSGLRAEPELWMILCLLPKSEGAKSHHILDLARRETWVLIV